MFLWSSGLIILALAMPAFHLPLGLALTPAGMFLQSGRDFESMATDLSKKGLIAKAPASIIGKSGVKHEFAFALVPETGKAKIVLDTELSVKEVDEMKVLKFYVKVFDVGPEKSVLCVSPKLGARAATLAKEYGIVVIEDDVPRKLIPLAEKLVNETIGSGGK
jgi:hypothetical protein